MEKLALRRQQSRMKNPSDVREIYLLPSGRDDFGASESLPACAEILMGQDEILMRMKINSHADEKIFSCG